MTIIASTLFFLAAAVSVFAIYGSIAQSMSRILEVIENRNIAEGKMRKITLGPVKTLSSTAYSMPTNSMPAAKLRQSAFAVPRPADNRKSKLPAGTLALAA